MAGSRLEAEGFAHYLDQLRRGSGDAYAAYRIYEQSWHVPRDEVALLRRATIRLIEADPWFVVTASPQFLYALTPGDLERLTPLVGTGPARGAAAMLRATLWYHGCGGPAAHDRAGRAQLTRVLGFLQRVPKPQREPAWHEMLVGCYRALDYARYKRAFATLLALTPPIWRASKLHSFLEVVAAGRDWPTYDRYRRAWDQLPPGHHACECYDHDLHTNDGLRAAAAGRWDAIPDALARASAVRGCPHLNTGGWRLDLVGQLVAKRRQLDAARTYLERAAALGLHAEDVAALRRKLDAAARRR